MDDATDYDVQLKILIIGDSGVGKSSLLLRFTDPKHFADDLTPTIGSHDHTRVMARLHHLASRRGLQDQDCAARGHPRQAHPMGHRRPGALPHTHVLLLPRRTRHHLRCAGVRPRTQCVGHHPPPQCTTSRVQKPWTVSATYGQCGT